MSTLVALDISGPPASTHGRAAGEHDEFSPKPPLVSVIIPCYNGEAFLREAIESVLTQSYPWVEVVVIDDGSTDGSARIAQAFDIRYFYQSNQGLTASRNLGIRESNGSYIVFLDADDRLLPDAIATGLAVLMQRPDCAMTVGDHLFVSADGTFLSKSRKPFLAAAHYEGLLRSNFIEMISSVIFRRSVFDEAGAFDTELRVAEDYELYLRIARNHAMCCHTGVVAEYRLHKANASHNSELMLTMTLQVLLRQRPYVLRHLGRLLAFAEGSKRWRKQYGRQLASELARTFPALGMKQLRRKTLVLANYYPQGLIVVLLLRMMPKLSKRTTSSGDTSLSEEKPLLKKTHAWLNASKRPAWTPLS